MLFNSLLFLNKQENCTLYSHGWQQKLISIRRGLNNLTQLWFHSWIKDDYCCYRKKRLIAPPRTRHGSREPHERDLRGEASLQACDGVFGVLTFPLMCSYRMCLRAFFASPWKDISRGNTITFHYPHLLLFCHLSSICRVHCGSCCTAGRWLGCWSPRHHRLFSMGTAQGSMLAASQEP